MPRFGDRLIAEPIIAGNLLNLCGQKVGAQSQVDKARTGDFRRLTKIGQVEPFDHLSRHVARRLTKLFGQRHRKVGLKVAKTGVLCRAYHFQQRCCIRHKFLKCGGETLANQ